MSHGFPRFKPRFFQDKASNHKNEKATMKAATPKLLNTKTFPSQSPIFPKTLVDFMVLSSMVPS
jgi:hypothetical protein